jgi:hypothetical protein
MRNTLVNLILLISLCSFVVASTGVAQIRIATFNVDATPPIGSPVAYAKTRTICDPLSARGIVLLSEGRPIVLCAVDWIGIANSAHDQWRETLAQAAGTTPDRVSVQTLHQHDGVRSDFATEALLRQGAWDASDFDTPFARQVMDRCAKAIDVALTRVRPVTHLGLGKARVHQVASNRRILGEDGKVAITRWSRCTDPAAIAAPEGLIDPLVRLVSFFDGETPVAVLTYYATHPMSHYGQGDVSADFVGLARAQREADLPSALHVHFTGASGNITAGKYNDGSEKMRPILTQRLADAMQRAWQSVEKIRIGASDVDWRVQRVQLPLGKHLNGAALSAQLNDPNTSARDRLGAASRLAWVQRHNRGHASEISCLHIGNASLLNMPGELFVEYQIAARDLQPQRLVCMAAYGDYGPGYIGTEISYTQGGYEIGPTASLVAPEVEDVLMGAIKRVITMDN